MHDLHSLIGDYYGLDWATLIIGVYANYMLSGGRLRLGFALNIVACTAAFGAATLSGQHGFIVYNVLLIALSMRGILRGDRRKPKQSEITPASVSSQVIPAIASAPVHAQ